MNNLVSAHNWCGFFGCWEKMDIVKIDRGSAAFLSIDGTSASYAIVAWMGSAECYQQSAVPCMYTAAASKLYEASCIALCWLVFVIPAHASAGVGYPPLCIRHRSSSARYIQHACQVSTNAR